jgi:hypothetical protein
VGDEIAAEYEEKIYAEEAARERRELSVDEQYEQDGDAAQSIKGRLVSHQVKSNL